MKTFQKIQVAAIVVALLVAVRLADSMNPTLGELVASVALVISGFGMTAGLVKSLESKQEAE